MGNTPDDYEVDLLATNRLMVKSLDEAVGLLKRVAASTGKTVKSGAGQQTQQKKANQKKDEQKKGDEKLLTSNKIQETLLKQIKGAAEQTMAMQKDSLARGKNIAHVMAQYSNMSLKMSEAVMGGDGLAGYKTTMQANFDLWRGGFKKNNYELARLTVAAKVTGQNSQELIRNLRQNTAGTGMNNEELSSLADTTLRMQQQFGVTSQELTSAVTKLGESLRDYAVLGIATEANEAATILGAMLGQEFAAGGAQILAAYTKGDSIVQAQILGVMDERRRFLAGDMRAGIDLVVAAGKSAEQTFERWSTAGADSAFMIDNAAAFMGDKSKQAAQVWLQLQHRADEEGFINVDAMIEHATRLHQINKEFTATWGTFVDRVFSIIQVPVMRFTALVTPLLKTDWAMWLARIAAGFVLFKTVTKWIPNLIGQMRNSFRAITGLELSAKGLKKSIDANTIAQRMNMSRGGLTRRGTTWDSGMRQAAPLAKIGATAGKGAVSASVLARRMIPGGGPKAAGGGAKMLASGKLVYGNAAIQAVKKGTATPLAKAVGGQGLKVMGKAGAAIGKRGLTKIPVLGAMLGLGFAASRLMRGDVKGAGMELASGALSTVPVVGTLASLGMDAAIIKRDLDGLKNSTPSVPTANPQGPQGWNRRTTEILEQIALDTTHANEQRDLRIEQGERGHGRPTDLIGE